MRTRREKGESITLFLKSDLRSSYLFFYFCIHSNSHVSSATSILNLFKFCLFLFGVLLPPMYRALSMSKKNSMCITRKEERGEDVAGSMQRRKKST